MIHSRSIFFLLLVSVPFWDALRLHKKARSSHKKAIGISKDLHGNVSHSTSKSGSVRLGEDFGPEVHSNSGQNAANSIEEKEYLLLTSRVHSTSGQNAANSIEEKEEIDWPHVDLKAETKRPSFHREAEAPMKKSVPPSGDLQTGSRLGGAVSHSNGPEAAAQLEVAAGLVQPSSPEGKPAKELRPKVAASRFGEVEVIPYSFPEPPKKVRNDSFDSTAAGHDNESLEHDIVEEERPEPPELYLNAKQHQLMTNLEMWLMDEIPVLYRVYDSEELPESLQEDAQAFKIAELIAQESKDAQQRMLIDWLTDPPDGAQRNRLANLIMAKVGKIQETG